MLLSLSQRDARYSHAGIVAVENGGIFVYHALGGEGSQTPGIRRDRFQDFCSPAIVHAFGIYRLKLEAGQARELVDEARRLYACQLPYDTDYDLQSDSAMYCTEFLYKLLQRAKALPDCIHLSSVPGLNYVACDDLYLHASASCIYTYSYHD
jgi:hypothetical protein